MKEAKIIGIVSSAILESNRSLYYRLPVSCSFGVAGVLMLCRWNLFMRISFVAITIAVAIGGTFSTARTALSQGPASIDAQRVQKAIDDAKKFLASRQNNLGKWEGYEEYGCGQTSLVTLALLNSGSSPDDPVVAKAMTYIRGVQPTKTYECALQCMVLCAATPNKDWKLIERNVKWLIDAQQKAGQGQFGGWDYDQRGNGADPSNSQFALLGLWEAQRIGVPVPADTLNQAYAYWRTKQQRDGGWPYSSGSSGSMTCAGIASMLIAEDALDATGDASVRNQKIQCCQGNQGLTAVDYGVEWLSRNYSIQTNPQGTGFWTYYLYALERVGRLTGLRFIGDHDWYREGCELLVQRQDPVQGYFRPDLSENMVSTTALGILFLSKGKRQVVMGRLDYRKPNSQENDWALHRRGVQNLTGHIERVWKRDLSWQTVGLSKAKLVDLLECPVLFLSGRGRLQFTNAEKALLKEYVAQGGFLFAEACNGDGCNGQEFEDSFKALVEELFDEPLRKLSPSHPIWSAEVSVDPNTLPPDFWLYGVEQCCRTVAVYSPVSLSCRWDIYKPYGITPNWNEQVLGELQNAAKIGINVVSYATGRELKQKLDAVNIIEPKADATPNLRGTLFLPKLQHGGGADDVPRAIPNLLEAMRREIQNQVASRNLLIAPSEKDLEKYPLVYIHGRQKFSWTAEQRKALRQYLTDRGGFLLGDAICGSTEFADALRNELREILPEATLQRVPADHPMLTQEYYGFNVQRVTIVDPSSGAKGGGTATRRTGSPSLEMLVWKDGEQERVVAIFSPLDISCALESRGATQCRGYIPQDAAKIAINMILFAHLQESAGVATPNRNRR